MSTIAATTEETIWKCDNCENLASSPNAFTLPPGWWQAHIQRKTEGGRIKRGTIDACSRQCLMDVIQYTNQHFIPYV